MVMSIHISFVSLSFWGVGVVVGIAADVCLSEIPLSLTFFLFIRDGPHLFGSFFSLFYCFASVLTSLNFGLI